MSLKIFDIKRGPSTITGWLPASRSSLLDGRPFARSIKVARCPTKKSGLDAYLERNLVATDGVTDNDKAIVPIQVFHLFFNIWWAREAT
jgi:hypothetical protein